MSTPTEYRLLKERHDRLKAAIEALADDYEDLPALHHENCGRWDCLPTLELRALLEGDTR